MRTNSQARNAFTLVEIMVSGAILAIVGGMAFVVLNTGMGLYANNTSVNVAHQEARMAMVQMERELHSAVSPVQLVDEDGSPVNGNGPAAGLSFQVFAAGPFKVVSKASSGQKQITMALGDFQVKTTQRLVIANHELEIDIAAAVTGTGDRVLTLVDNIPNTVNIEVDDAGKMEPVQVVGLITERIQFTIKDGELRYRDRNGKISILARDITSDKPFSKPTKGSANPNSRAIAAVNLTTGKKGGKKGKFRSANMYLNAEVPARAILCNKP
jgi:type II secretory pathway pseudopilin PulG